MNKKIHVGLMLGFYGQLLTERQEEIVQMYYDHDLSLGEIAQNLRITRQGVFDNIKRSEKALYNIENKLGLVEKFIAQKAKISQALDLIRQIEKEIKDKDMENTYNSMKAVENILNTVIND